MYSGDVLAWYSFGTPKSNIDSRNLTDVDKLSCLQTYVSGDAENAIEGLSTTNINYGIAILILKERAVWQYFSFHRCALSDDV